MFILYICKAQIYSQFCCRAALNMTCTDPVIMIKGAHATGASTTNLTAYAAVEK